MFWKYHLQTRTRRFAGFLSFLSFFVFVCSSGGTPDISAQTRRIAGRFFFLVCTRRTGVGGHVCVLVYTLDAGGRKWVTGPWLRGLSWRRGHIFLVFAGVTGESGEAGHRISRK
jgi:hypothetical protein